MSQREAPGTTGSDVDTMPRGSEVIGQSHAPHVLQRTIVVERLRLLYTPVPKSGCTALLWSLAGLANLYEGQFVQSAGREVTRTLAIHDLNRWPESFRFGERNAEERDAIVTAADWFRFTVVRHPYRRLWSAWQSKILLAEPQFIERYSSEPWWPGPVRSASDVLKAFRQFMDALRAEPELLRADVHWAPQVDVIHYPALTYDHIGQVEELGATLERLREHLRSYKTADFADPPRANVSSLPYADELFTEEDAQFLNEMYAGDLSEFGYDPPPDDALGGNPSASWAATVDAVTPALEELRLRHERVADLQQLLRARDKRVREAMREKKREKSLRREEHRRNQHLQKRLRHTSVQLENMRTSRTWRYTAPLRSVGARLRRRRQRG